MYVTEREVKTKLPVEEMLYIIFQCGFFNGWMRLIISFYERGYVTIEKKNFCV